MVAGLKGRNTNPMSNGISADNNDLYSNSQMHIHDNSSHPYSNSHSHHLYNPSLNTQTSHPNPTVPTVVSNAKIPKPRKKRKANDPNTSFEDEAPGKARKRKSEFILSMTSSIFSKLDFSSLYHCRKRY